MAVVASSRREACGGQPIHGAGCDAGEGIRKRNRCLSEKMVAMVPEGQQPAEGLEQWAEGSRGHRVAQFTDTWEGFRGFQTLQKLEFCACIKEQCVCLAKLIPAVTEAWVS